MSAPDPTVWQKALSVTPEEFFQPGYAAFQGPPDDGPWFRDGGNGHPPAWDAHPQHPVPVPELPWEMTGPLPAVVDMTPEPCTCEFCEWAAQFPAWERPCHCDECRYGHVPGAGLVLYSRRGGEALRRLVHVREGWYEDIPAGFDRVEVRYAARFAAAARRAHMALETGYRQVAAACGRAA